ncbi:flagellar assembly protein FliH [Massilia sp. TS11]|uniref:flagellar assembly protein FliH n=1 Tax=Massilia sp. TS11 TaxID=2908003 RepID=UPI001EDBCB1A|nr:flagellar assembly protein FliH [Massilia sp. TS11]MCG2582879.1 flagellar assembly protein FliH [Massilia sp. TS11]
MSNLPKELQTAYQRWEMTSFGDNRPSAKKDEPPPVILPTEDDVAQIKEEARVAGYEAGHAAGYADGLARGKLEADQELAHLQQIALGFSQALKASDETVAHDVLELALQLARGMLRQALQVKPELVIPIVKEAISYLPIVHQPATITLHPDDAEIVRAGIGEELEQGGWRVVEDPIIQRGGCRVDTATNQMDAQASHRWARLMQALGQDLEWLA